MTINNSCGMIASYNQFNMKGINYMKKFLDKIAATFKMSFAIRHIRLDQPNSDEDRYAMIEMFEER